MMEFARPMIKRNDPLTDAPISRQKSVTTDGGCEKQYTPTILPTSPTPFILSYTSELIAIATFWANGADKSQVVRYGASA